MPDACRFRLSPYFRGDISQLRAVAPQGRPQVDDLDLSAMARSALNYLRGNPEAGREYECKFSLGPLGIPCHHPEWVPPNEYGYDPIAIADTDCRMYLQYPHMRQVAEESSADDVEFGVTRRVLGYLRDDGLAWANPASWTGQPIEGYWANTWASGKIMAGLAEHCAASGSDEERDKAAGIVRALMHLAHWDGERAFYPGGPAPVKDGRWLQEGWCQSHARNYPSVVEPSVRYWECCEASGGWRLGRPGVDGEGLRFARAMVEGFLAGLQQNQGDHRIDPETGAFAGHVHLHTHAVWGVAHLGAVLGEKRYLDWARRAYDFVHSHGTDYGWYPEFIPQPEWRTEICVVGDMVSTAVWLARAGAPDLWDHVERAVRNLLRTSQFSLSPAFVGLFESLHADRGREAVDDGLSKLTRLEGGFVAQPGFNDWVSYFGTLGQAGIARNGIHMMGCCPPEGMRALWEAWCGVVEERRDGVYVNIGISREHPAARVIAYRPEYGRLDVQTHKADHYAIRPPAWVDRDQVELTRNGHDWPVSWDGPDNAYVVCANVARGEVLSVTYPVPRFTQSFIPSSVPDRRDELTVHWVGNTVRAVEPGGQYLPMFG